jgi:hypothetical protein
MSAAAPAPSAGRAARRARPAERAACAVGAALIASGLFHLGSACTRCSCCRRWPGC